MYKVTLLNPMTIQGILSRTLELIREPDNWIKEVYAINESPTAGKYCLVGALSKAAASDTGTIEEIEEAILQASSKIQSILKEMPQEYKQPNLEYFNDHRDTSHEDVIEILKKAIEKC